MVVELLPYSPFAVLVIVSIVGLLTRMTIVNFSSVFLIAMAIQMCLSYMIHGMIGFLFVLVAGILAVINVVNLAGIFGRRLQDGLYSAVLVAVGIFPWYMHLTVSLVYVLTLLVSILGILYIHTTPRLQYLVTRVDDYVRVKLNKPLTDIDDNRSAPIVLNRSLFIVIGTASLISSLVLMFFI